MNKNVTETGLVENFVSKLLKKKNPDDLIEQSKKGGLNKTLTAFDLIILGVSAVIGSGIFVMIGAAALGTSDHIGAGPSLLVSIVLAAVACIFPALCYAEFASMIPVAGSAYTYTFATMGELAAWIIGWILMLEYAIGNITVASSWTGYFFQLLQGFDKYLPAWLTNPPLWVINEYHTAVEKYTDLGIDPNVAIPHICGVPICLNAPAIFIMLALAAVLTKGMKESTKVATFMVFVKLAVIALFVGVGAFYVKPENWAPFAPNGMQGVIIGAFVIFYAYIGFDAISTAAEETKNPQKDLPIGLIASLVICSLIYGLVALVFSGIIPYGSPIDMHAPIAAAMKMVGQNGIAGLISVGALAGLTSVLLVLQFGTTRILYAMARDNFFPSVMKKVHPKYQTPYVITWTTVIIVCLCSLFMDMNVAAELCIFGTFTSFIIVCIGVLILRHTDPKRERPFRVPFCPWTPLLGICICSYLMFEATKSLHKSPMLFPVWILIGLVIYFLYGYRKNRKVEAIAEQEAKQEEEKAIL
ncbi:MAG: amino acid permease [Candidatus Gastranaerophilales bacterium]|nr:amino acid permease [Candidatus Gastranaerophilales bacterium]